MDQKIEELLIEISMLHDDLSDTKKMLGEKQRELQSVCRHEKVQKMIVKGDLLFFSKAGLESPKNGSYIIYQCLICMAEMFREQEDPELEKRVVK